jgi:hypothetical protein
MDCGYLLFYCYGDESGTALAETVVGLAVGKASGSVLGMLRHSIIKIRHP